MARRKDSITQRDFSLGAVRPEAVERDDTEIIDKSLKEAKNAVTLSIGAVEGRSGSIFMGFTGMLSAVFGFGVDLGGGREYDLHIGQEGVILYNKDGTVEASFTSYDWSTVSGIWDAPGAFVSSKFWVIADPDSSSIVIGSKHYPLHALVVDDAGSWSFGVMNFATKANGAILQPYWNYHRGVTIAPSALTGSITVTASASIWTSDYNGLRIRYGDREIVLGAPVSGTVINATVTEDLAPTINLTVASVTGYEIGDAVEHSDLGGQGIITDISGSVITVLATAFWDGFTNSGNLTAPNANQTISVKASTTPAASGLWDMQMQSPIHGYAGHGTKHMGRSYLCGFPGAAQGFAASAAGFIDDFTLGANDGDGFVETLGANDGGSLRYIVSAEDLLFLTSKGLYYQQTRDGSAVTPRTIAPSRFSRLGCADVTPVAIDDGLIFVDALGSQIYGAMLTGQQYRSWSALHLSKFHAHLFSQPIRLGATSDGTATGEEYVYVVEDGGGAVVGRLDRDSNSVGWHPWETEGDYWAIYQAFGETRQIVHRSLSAGAYCREKMVDGIYVDCAAALSVTISLPNGFAILDSLGRPTHLVGKTASVYFVGFDGGDREIDASGFPLDDEGNQIGIPDYLDDTGRVYQIGYSYEMRLLPWPRRSVNSYRGKRDVKREIALNITVQDTGLFEYDGQDFGGYRVGEDLSAPPSLRTEEASFINGGREFYGERPIVRSRPGPFRLLKLRYKVTI